MRFFTALVFQAVSKIEPRWHETWPFGPGVGEGFFSVVLKCLFIAAILGGMAWVLRRLFGPGGPWRDKEFDEPDPELRSENNDPDQHQP